MGMNVSAPNINYNLPVRTVPGRAKGKCKDCGQVSTLAMNIKGNVGTVVKGSAFARCAYKKCETKPDIKIEFSVKIQ